MMPEKPRNKHLTNFGLHNHIADEQLEASAITSLSVSSDTQPSSRSISTQKKHPDLGQLQVVYHGKRLSKKGWFFLVFTSLLIVLFVFLVTIWQYWLFGEYYGYPASDQWYRNWLYASGILLGLLVLIFLYQLRKAFRIIHFYQHGILYRTGIFTKGTILFNQISGITIDNVQEHFFGKALRNIQKITIINSEGGKLAFDQKILQIDNFIQRLKTVVYPRLFPTLQDQFNTGMWLIFGPVQISQTGVIISSSNISWEDISNVFIENGWLNLDYNKKNVKDKTLSKRIRIPTSRILNLEILLQFIQTGLLS